MNTNTSIRIASATLLLLALTGCGRRYGDSYLVRIDTSFTSAGVDLTPVLNAVNDWQSKVPVRLEARIEACHGSAEGEICLHWGDPPGGFGHNLGYEYTTGDTDGGEIWIIRTLWGAGLQQAVTHELGHAMGLKHTKAGDIMAPQQGIAAWTVAPGDIAQWRSLRQ